MTPLLICAEVSKVPWFILGGVLAVWAVVIATVGLRHPGFPATKRSERGVMLLSLLLMALAIAAGIVTG